MSLKFKSAVLIVACLLCVSCLKKQKNIGGITPEEAFTYMTTNKDLVIVDTATKLAYENIHFINALNIPTKEMEERVNEIPTNTKVILHCRRGVSVKLAYEELINKRKDLKEVSFIDGTPLFEEYNSWFSEQEVKPSETQSQNKE